jgi:hypothetical protein
MITAALTGQATGFNEKRVVDLKPRQLNRFCSDENLVLIRVRGDQTGLEARQS